MPVFDEQDARPIQQAPVGEKLEGATVTTGRVSPDDLEYKVLTRSLLRKLDIRILPLLVLLVLCSFLDRTNVGNAKLYNLESDLGMANGQYNQGLAAFYPLYIAA